MVVSSDYACPICHGFGFVHPFLRDTEGNVLADHSGKRRHDGSKVVPCRCREEQWRHERHGRLLKNCELPSGSDHMTFDNFKRNAGTESALKMAVAIADGSVSKDWLTFTGNSDRGKTHLAVAIARRRLERGCVAKYIYVPLLLDELRQGYQQKEGENSYESRFKLFLEVPLLIMDDLGVESGTDWVQEKLTTLIDYRLMHELQTVVTTNCNIDDLNSRIASRLQRGGKIICIMAQPFHGMMP